MARITASAGVPVTAKCRSSKACTRSGVCTLSDWLVALISRSGATTVTSAIEVKLRSSAFKPSAWMPSSLVTRIRFVAIMGQAGAVGP